MVKGTSFSFCVVTSVITHAMCNSIVSLFRQIWDSSDCAHTGKMVAAELEGCSWALLHQCLLEGGRDSSQECV